MRRVWMVFSLLLFVGIGVASAGAQVAGKIGRAHV